MKNLSFFTIGSLLCLFFMSSCSSSSDDDCLHCHLALVYESGNEVQFEMHAPGDAHEFCGDDLTAAQAPDYAYTPDEDLTVDGVTITAGTSYTNGQTVDASLFPKLIVGTDSLNALNWEIHCDVHEE